jgi:hypothetical protein
MEQSTRMSGKCKVEFPSLTKLGDSEGHSHLRTENEPYGISVYV